MKNSSGGEGESLPAGRDMDEEEEAEQQRAMLSRASSKDAEWALGFLGPEEETCPPWIVTRLIDLRAVGHLTALIETNRLDLNQLIPADTWSGRRLRPIHYAVRERFPDLIELFVRHGASPSALAPSYEYGEFCTILPIESLLLRIDDIRGKLETRVTDFYPTTLSDLIFWVTYAFIRDGPDTRATLKLMGRITDHGPLEARILSYARNGWAWRLISLLLALPGRVLSPTFLRWGLPSNPRFACFSLRDFLAAQLAYVTAVRLADVWRQRRPDDGRGDGLRNYLEKVKIPILTESLQLLEAFERAGPRGVSALLDAAETETEEYVDIEDALRAAGLSTPFLRNGELTWLRLEHTEPDYIWAPLREDYPELEFFTRPPPNLAISQILDSEFSKAIQVLCCHSFLKEWTIRKPIFKLLFIFCHPEMVEKMQCMASSLELLKDAGKAGDPAYFAELCFVYITEGRIVEFTAALMVGRVLLKMDYPLRPPQLIMPNNINNVEEGLESSRAPSSSATCSSPTLYELLLRPLMTVLDQEISFLGESSESCAVQACKQKKLMISYAFRLIKIFETSAQHIRSYLHSQRYKEVSDLKMIVGDVASLLMDSGFVVKARHIRVDDLKCFSGASTAVSKTRSNVQKKEVIIAGIPKQIMPSTNIGSSCCRDGSSISNQLMARSYRSSSPSFGYIGFKDISVTSRHGVSLRNTRADQSTKLFVNPMILRKGWRFTTMIKKILL
ncbi:unnamed protein product [Linum trigynum]|uniref:Uncharacterized protein n=1 Tax=Linum trigynum TaxID=586398 RepID=A0AAV2EDW4_9ROSI